MADTAVEPNPTVPSPKPVDAVVVFPNPPKLKLEVVVVFPNPPNALAVVVGFGKLNTEVDAVVVALLGPNKEVPEKADQAKQKGI